MGALTLTSTPQNPVRSARHRSRCNSPAATSTISPVSWKNTSRHPSDALRSLRPRRSLSRLRGSWGSIATRTRGRPDVEWGSRKGTERVVERVACLRRIWSKPPIPNTIPIVNLNKYLLTSLNLGEWKHISTHELIQSLNSELC
jgi:hypothetical protein